VAVVDLEPVEVLVLQGAEGALADAVLLRALAGCGYGSAPASTR
jgi:hypothetical protein